MNRLYNSPDCLLNFYLRSSAAIDARLEQFFLLSFVGSHQDSLSDHRSETLDGNMRKLFVHFLHLFEAQTVRCWSSKRWESVPGARSERLDAASHPVVHTSTTPAEPGSGKFLRGFLERRSRNILVSSSTAHCGSVQWHRCDWRCFHNDSHKLKFRKGH